VIESAEIFNAKGTGHAKSVSKLIHVFKPDPDSADSVCAALLAVEHPFVPCSPGQLDLVEVF
jgi:hypothetical protein